MSPAWCRKGTQPKCNKIVSNLIASQNLILQRTANVSCCRHARALASPHAGRPAEKRAQSSTKQKVFRGSTLERHESQHHICCRPREHVQSAVEYYQSHLKEVGAYGAAMSYWTHELLLPVRQRSRCQPWNAAHARCLQAAKQDKGCRGKQRCTCSLWSATRQAAKWMLQEQEGQRSMEPTKQASSPKISTRAEHAKETALPRWAAGHGSSRTLIIQKGAALKTLPKDGLEGWSLLRLAQPAAESGSCFTLKLQAVVSSMHVRDCSLSSPL